MTRLRAAVLFSLTTGTFAASLHPSARTHVDITPDAFATTSFDYIIIGGGTAGLAVATRLAEGTQANVGVIEAGAYYPDEPKINVPGLFGSIAGDPKFDWLHMTTPQPGLNNASQLLPRAKVLGGTSAMNTMVWSRASKKEYDVWEGFGNPGWNWQNILKYSKKSEAVSPAPKSTPPDLLYTFNPSHHGSTGPIKISYPSFSSNIVPVVFKTMKAWGLLPKIDPADGADVGAVSMMNSVNIKNATRSYSASAYLAPYGGKNLIVLTNAQVTKINLASKADKHGNYAATGITYFSNNHTYTVKVKREVIVSGGTYNTPQILELSGIGNKKIVTKAGVKSIVDLPGVGENLQDHMQLILKPMELVKGKFTTRDILSDPAIAAKAMDEYNKNHTGPLSSSLVSVGYLPLSKFMDKSTKAKLLKGLDSELAAVAHQSSPADKLTHATQRSWLNEDNVASLELLIFPLFLSSDPADKPKANTSYVTFGLCPHHTFARGTTHISSSNGLAQPVIDPKFFSYKYDKEMMVQAVKYAVKFIQKEPIKSAIAVNPYNASWSDESFIRSYISTFTTSEFHPLGTSALLPRSKHGVVDPELKVYGTSNIRVVDASIIPNHISSHIQATVYAIAEHAADIILDSH